MRTGRQERHQQGAHLDANGSVGSALVVGKRRQLRDERLMAAKFLGRGRLGAGPGLSPKIGDPVINHPQTIVGETQQSLHTAGKRS